MSSKPSAKELREAQEAKLRAEEAKLKAEKDVVDRKRGVELLKMAIDSSREDRLSREDRISLLRSSVAIAVRLIEGTYEDPPRPVAVVDPSQQPSVDGASSAADTQVVAPAVAAPPTQPAPSPTAVSKKPNKNAPPPPPPPEPLSATELAQLLTPERIACRSASSCKEEGCPDVHVPQGSTSVLCGKSRAYTYCYVHQLWHNDPDGCFCMTTEGWRPTPLGGRIFKLKELGYDPNLLRSADVPASLLLSGHFNATDLRNGGYTARELTDAGVTTSQLREAGYNAREMKEAGFNAATIEMAGWSISELHEGGYTAYSLLSEGFNAKDLYPVYSLVELVQGGFVSDELIEIGLTPFQVVNAGVSLVELHKRGGYELKSLVEFSVKDLRAAGYSLTEIKAAGHTLDHIHDAGFSAAEVMNQGFLEGLKRCGYSLSEVKAVNSSAIALKKAGFSASDLCSARYPSSELFEAGFQADDMASGGYVEKIVLSFGKPTRFFSHPDAAAQRDNSSWVRFN